MKIARVESFLMSYPLPKPLRLPFHNGERTILKRDAMYIRVTMDSGLRGYAPGPADERAHGIIRDDIAPALEGRDLRATVQQGSASATVQHGSTRTTVQHGSTRATVQHGSTRATVQHGSTRATVQHGSTQALPRRSREDDSRRRRARQKIHAAVEIALMDAVARSEGCALSEIYAHSTRAAAPRSLRAGRVRDEIKLYGSAGMYMSPAGYAEEAAAIQAMGFPAYKMRPARGPEADIESVRLMREATGPEFGLMIDAHSWWRMGDRSYSFDTVAAVASEMSRYRPAWLEEPLPPEDHDAYARLRSLGHVPVATGEHESDEEGFADLARRRAADFIQMDVCCQGGFAMGTRIVKAAEDAGLRFAFHSWGTTLEVLAAAHFGVCWPASVVEWLEYPCYANGGRAGMYPFPLADEILKEPLDIRDGHLIVPKGPGLGIEIDERVVEKYPFIPGPWSYFQIHSPPNTIAVTGDHSLKWV